MSIVVARGLPIEEADRIADEVERRIHRDMPHGYCVIHMNAAELDVSK